MKKTLFMMSLLLTLFVGFTSCSSDDDNDGKLMTDKTSVTFLAKQGASENISIIASKDWIVSGIPEWLNASSTSGRGNSTITLTTKSVNNTVAERNAELMIQSGNEAVYVTVIQETSIAAGCTVKPMDIVELATGVAFDFSCGSNVAYFYRAIFSSSSTDRYTEDEIIAEMTKNKNNRLTPGDDVVSSFTGMTPLANYVIYTIGYDKDGNRGELVRTDIRTKSGTNQALATISDVRYSSTKWQWQTSPNGYTERYYQWFVESENLYSLSDPAIAWFFKKVMDSNNGSSDFAPIVKAQGWERSRGGKNVFHLVTWAKDVDGNFSGVIGRFRSVVSSSKANDGMYIVQYGSPAAVGQKTYRKSDYKEIE